MTVPPEPPPGDRNPDAEASPEGARSGEPTDREVDDAFAAMVAGWDPPATAEDVVPRAQTPLPAPPVTPEVDEQRADASEDDPFRNGSLEDDPFEDEGHFERPDAPRVDPPTRAAMGAIAFLVLGALLVVVPGLVGLTGAVGFPLGLVCISGGLVFLLSRLKAGPPTDSGWDDGAQL